MNKKYLVWLIGGVLFLTALWIGGQRWFLSMEASAISSDEAKKIVEERYPGEILHIEAGDHQFTVDVERETGTYRVVIHEKNGEIKSVKRIKEVENISENTQLTEEEVKAILTEKVPGTVQSIEQIKNGEKVVYQAVVNNAEQQQIVVIDSKSGEIMETTPMESSKRLTEQEAAQLALEHVPGQIDDIDSENMNGIIYYLVEVEAENGNEAVVEINSITGEVRSVTWDDDE